MIALVCLIAGCGDPSDTPGGPGDPIGTPGSPAAAPGPYRIVSRVDIPAEAVLPDQAAQVLATLRELSTNPAHALIAAADEAGVPAVAELYDLLPGPLTDHLEGWINDELAGVRVGGVPLTDYAGELAGVAATALTHVAIASELTIGAGTARHRLTALDLTPAGLAVQLPIDDLAGDVLTQDSPAAVGRRGALTLGEQHFGLDYGELAWRTIEAVSQDRSGAGVRDALGGAVDCSAVAARVAARCVLGVCVGHDALLTELCAAGLDAVVDLAHEQVAGMRIEVLHLASGRATLVDDDGDGLADRITAGTWQAEIDLGPGLRSAPASFTGSR